MGHFSDWLINQAEDELAKERGPCPFRCKPETCKRCKSDDPDVFWDSCANTDNRDAFDDACWKD